VSRENVVNGLFSRFVQLRQAGMSRDDAWANIAPKAQTLHPAEQAHLTAMLRQWEAGRSRSPGSTPPLRRRSAPQEHGQIRRIRPINATPDTRSPNEVACPKCGIPNTDGELYCCQCGALLLSEDQQADIGATQPIPTMQQQVPPPSARFTEGMVLYLRIRDTNQTLRVRPGRGELIIGRSSPDSVIIPDIDLVRFGAKSQSVSRLHALLRREGDFLLLGDLGSLNHTYLNNERLQPQELRVLNDGDTIRFGQLVVDVIFGNE